MTAMKDPDAGICIPNQLEVGADIEKYIWVEGGFGRESFVESSPNVKVEIETKPDYPHFSYEEEGFGLNKDFSSAKSFGISLPSLYVQKVSKDYSLNADEEMYQILQRYPYLEEALPQNILIWGLLKHGQGKPLYFTELTIRSADLKAATKMVSMAEMISQRFDGLVWDNQCATFESPDPQALVQMLAGQDIEPVLLKRDLYPPLLLVNNPYSLN